MGEIKAELVEGVETVAAEPKVESGITTEEPVGAQGIAGEPPVGGVKVVSTPMPPVCDLCKGKQKLECPACKDKPNPKCPVCKGTKEINCPACTESEMQKPTLMVQFLDPASIQFTIEAIGFHPAIVNLQMLAVAEFLKARVSYVFNQQFAAQDEERRVQAGIQNELLRGVKPGMKVSSIRR